MAASSLPQVIALASVANGTACAVPASSVADPATPSAAIVFARAVPLLR